MDPSLRARRLLRSAQPQWQRQFGARQTFFDALCDYVSIDWSDQKLFVTSRAGDCIADCMRRQVARKDKEERELNSGKRRPKWWGKSWGSSSVTVSPFGPVDFSGDQSKSKGNGPSRIDAICSSVQRRLTWARKLFRSSSLARFTILAVSPRNRRPPRVHLHRYAMSLCPCHLSMCRVWRTYADT